MTATTTDIRPRRMARLSTEEWDAILFHVLFTLIAALLYFVTEEAPGMIIFYFLAAYNVSTALFALVRGHGSWIRAWGYVLPVSATLLFADLFLANEFASVVFNDTGSPEIGRVPAFMALIWTIPLFIIVMCGRWISYYLPTGLTYLAVALLSGLVFGAADLLPEKIPLWYPQHVLAVGPVAVYALCSRVVLGTAVFAGWSLTRGQGLGVKAVSVFTVMFIYLGALTFFYFLVERILVF